MFGAAGGAMFLLFATEWLYIDERPEPADAILLLAGEPSRALHAAELYSRGLAPLVYVPKPIHSRSQRVLEELGIPFPPQEKLYEAILVKKGVPKDRIRVQGHGFMSTLEEALAARGLSLEPRHTLLVVTSPYHVRRVKMIFNRVLPQIRVIVVADPHEPYPRRWWTNQDVARNVVLETLKIAFFLAGGRYLSTVRGSDDI
jgi:uncharacterized SAM-binding protein YcdF (DUF218 family)